MAKVLFAGFFGMQKKHTIRYIDLWKKLGSNVVDHEPYELQDIFRVNAYPIIREKFCSRQPHYDIVYCISGGSLHMLNLIKAKNSFTFDRIVFDSGPYQFSVRQAENYAQQLFPWTKMLPMYSALNMAYKKCTIPLNKEHRDFFLNVNVPKLILTSKTDLIIDSQFIAEYTKSQSNCTHIQFATGAHANIYKTNQDEYENAIFKFLNT